MKRRIPGLAFIVLVAGCGANYSGDYTSDYASGEVRPARALSLECLDVRVTRRAGDDVRLVYEIGNRCLGPVDIDLSQVQVSGGSGLAMTRLPPRDPRRELRPARLDGHGMLSEVIAYASADRAPPRVCVVLEGLTAGAPTEPVCLDGRGGGRDADRRARAGPAVVWRDESMRYIGEEGRDAAAPAPAAEARREFRRGHLDEGRL
ncbi:MAG: hypothetical protein AB8I08_16275 [Sandaracinaceae bacterium]